MSDPARSDKIPQPRPRPLLGNAMDVDPEAGIQSFMRLSRELGPIYRMSFPGREVLVLSSHDLVAEACDETRFAKYIHGALNNIRDFAGDGLFTARNEEPNWSKAHRLLMPAFGPAAMRGYFADMLDITDQMLTKWERLGPEESLNVSDNMTRLTLDTIALCGFAYRFNSFYQKELHPFVESMVRALQEAGRRGRRLPLQNRLMFMTRQKYEADAEFMDGVTARLITQRKRLPPEEAPRDLLSLMLTAKDPLTGERLDEQNIRYQLVTFLIAGHETTSGLLSFAVHLLLKHPEVLQRAQAEVDRVLGAQLPRFEQVAQLGYIEQILRETLRLYPTAPAFAVQAKHDTVLGGRYPLKKGQALMVLTPMLHRDPAVWSEPERFDPDRFAPGAREKLPPKAWLPFGNGERSCIGRAFALQEATLVIAMLLQRFTFWSPTPYELKIKETLTLKPEGLVVRARLRKTIERGATPRPPAMPAPVASSLPDAAGVVAHRTPLLVLYGSNSGSAEAFARRIASDGEARGYVTHVAPLDDYAGKLSPGGAVAIVTASYNGQPPDNAAAFVAWLGSVPAGSLAGVRYTVFGCGNRDWVATYQAVPKLIDQRLHDAGAEALFARGEADASADFFGDFERWYAPLWNRLGESLGITSRPVDLGPLYTVEAVPPASLELVKQNKLELVTLVENRELVNLQATAAPARSKRHIEFALPAGSTYSAGDYLALLPENHPELIARAASRFGLRLDAAIVLHSSRGAMAASLPTGRPISVQELLGRHVELSAPATRKDIERLAANNPCPPHQQHLRALSMDAARYKQEILDKRVSVLDLLTTYPSSALSLAEFLEMLPAMRVRQYSISSSPRWNATHCTLTVAVVDAPALSGIGQFHGICSSYLTRLRPGDQIPAAVRASSVPFHPPADNATPIILICAGTGIAPFRGFLQERALRRAAGEPTGVALLFFGCDHPDVDFLYRDELMQWESQGVVTVLPAFAMQPQGEVRFVQHRVWQERARIRALFTQGATVFVCGDGRHMAPAVRETLIKTYQEAKHCSDSEASVWAADVERRGRYVPDVFA